MHPTLNIALRAANAAAEKLIYTREHWTTLVEEAGVSETLQQLYQGAAKRTFNTIRKAHPEHPVRCEQTGDFGSMDSTAETHWQVDVLLGEDNYRRSLSDCGVLISQWQKNRMEHLMLVFPFLSMEVMASRGRGMQINGRRVRTGKSDRLNQAFAGSVLRAKEQVLVFTESGAEVRVSGCALLDFCRVSAGHLDIAAHDKLSALEVAAAQMLATESGAVTGDFAGAPVNHNTNSLICANPRLFKAAMVALRQA